MVRVINNLITNCDEDGIEFGDEEKILSRLPRYPVDEIAGFLVFADEPVG